LGLSSYRASLELHLSRVINHRFTDEEFLFHLANMLNIWFITEQSVFKDDHLWLLSLLDKKFDLQCKFKENK